MNKGVTKFRNNPAVDDNDVEREVEFGTLAEQLDETCYDHREDADDDLEKGCIKFPRDKLYGRDKELQELHQVFSALHSEQHSSLSSSENKCNSNSNSNSNTLSPVVFLGGYSGTGKSALVEEFLKQIKQQHKRMKAKGNKTLSSIHFISGKFSQMGARGDPYSSITQAVNMYVKNLSSEDLKSLEKRLAKVEIFWGSEYATVLADTLIPSLETLLHKNSAVKRTSSFMCHDINVVKYAFQAFVKALATETAPLVFFIDDVQWMDDASCQLLRGLFKDKSLSHTLFIASYRINEVNGEHELTKMIKELQERKGSDRTKVMEISNLPPDCIARFIADSIEKEPEEVAPIADVVYSKTLGNIFYVKQALEELVRKNAIYFDVICYTWQFGDVSRVALEQFLSSDVIEMVLAKIQTLPKQVQKAMALAAYANDTIELDLLAALLNGESIDVDRVGLLTMMKLANAEGLILRANGGGSFPAPADLSTKYYKFAHDRIREAAQASIPEGNEREQLKLRVAKVLLSHEFQQDWMSFKAATLLNSVPEELTDSIELAKLNCKVGEMASSKGAFREAVVFLRAGHERLDPSTCWKDHYDLSIRLKTGLIKAEHFLGNHDRTITISNDIFDHAKTLAEKSQAHFCHIEATNLRNNNDHGQSAENAVEILALYDIDVPKNPSKMQVKMEKVRLNMALHGRSYLCLTKFPISTDPTIIATTRIATMAINYSVIGGRGDLTAYLAYRMFRYVLKKKCITKDCPLVVVALGVGFRMQEDFRGAFKLADLALSLLDRFPDENVLKSKMMVLGSLRIPFRDSIDANLEFNKVLFTKGETMYGIGSAMCGMLAYLNASLRLNVLYESKLMLYEEMSVETGRMSFVVVFRLYRQALYNLQGGFKASLNPVELKGAAFDEDEVQANLEGAARNMSNRDISMIRLMLSVFFNDEQGMEEMLPRLDSYPTSDVVVERQYLRMAFTAFASLILTMKTDKYNKWIKITQKFFANLASCGSANAIPVYACMKALQKPSIAAFDEAINVCGNAGLFNLAALMNERCGIFLLDQGKDSSEAEEYLRCAMWLYHDWGASNKVQHMQTRYDFLRTAINEKAPSQLSGIRKQFSTLIPASKDQLSEMQSAIMGASGTRNRGNRT